jgi:hypothetical protein
MVSPGLLKQRAMAIERQTRLVSTLLGKKRSEAAASLLKLTSAAAAEGASSADSSSSKMTMMIAQKKRREEKRRGPLPTKEATQPLLDAMRADARYRSDLAVEEQRRPGVEKVAAAMAFTNLKRKAEAIDAVVAKAASVQNWETTVVPSTVIWIDTDGFRQRSAVDLGPRIRKVLLMKQKQE